MKKVLTSVAPYTFISQTNHLTSMLVGFLVVHKLVTQSQIVQSVMQDCKYVLSHLLPVCDLLVQGPKITYNYCLSRRF